MKILYFLFASVTMVCFALDGNQVLHSKPNNKPYQRSEESIQFVNRYLSQAKPLESDAEVLRFASDCIDIDGAIIELGVWKGRTTNFLAALNPHKTIYGFDSFHGLPEDWDKGDFTLPKGAFAFQPEEKALYLLNIQLYRGWFSETLPQFLAEVSQPIAFAHVDCDIYSSTYEALMILGPRMQEGTILLFDEFYNYPNYQNHEWKALQEFLDVYSFEPEFIAYNPLHEQVALRLHKK